MRPSDRLFFAVYPDAAAAERIAALGAWLHAALGLKRPPFPPGRLHVTLLMLGDHAGLPPELVAQATQAAQSIAQAPFEVGFDRAASFPRRDPARPFVLLAHRGVEGLAALREALEQGLAAAGGAPTHERAFRPHLTLQYDPRTVPERPVEPVGWTVREFVLVHSLLGRSRHVPLARWPLRS